MTSRTNGADGDDSSLLHPGPGSGTQAAQRLTTSRARIARALRGGHGEDDEDAENGAENGASRRPSSARTSSSRRLTSMLLNELSNGGLQNPVRSVTKLGIAATRAGLEPLSRKHPWALVGAAAVAGMLLVSSSPWRALLRPALLASVASQLALQWMARRPDE